MTKTVSKFGNRLREIAEDVVSKTTPSIGEGIAARLRELASDIDADHADTLQRVNDISQTLNQSAR